MSRKFLYTVLLNFMWFVEIKCYKINPLNMYTAPEESVYSNYYFPYLMSSAYTTSPKPSSNQLFNNKPIFQRSSQEYINGKFLPNMWNLELQTKQLSAKTQLNDELSFGYPRNDSQQKMYDTNQYNNASAELLDAIEITDMTCEAGEDGFFKSKLAWRSNCTTTPVIDEQIGYGNENPCAIEEMDNKMVINLKSSSFNICGVKNCLGDNENRYLCLRLRFPSVLGLRLPEDSMLTLRCRVQEHMMSYTQRLGLSVNDAVTKGRHSQNKIATGGANNTVHSQLNAYRVAADGQFSRILRNGDAVSLGEELLLQIILFNENVWRWSRLSDVWLSGSLESDKVPLLTPDGCPLPQARAVCPKPPKQFGPFMHTLLIRAPMFANSLSESSVNLNVRVLACRHQRDCTSRCNRSSRTIHFANKPNNNNRVHDKTLQYAMKSLNITTENTDTLTYLSDTLENDYGDIRYQTNLNKNITDNGILKGGGKIKNNTTEKILNKDGVGGLFWASSGRNYMTRSRREVRGEMTRADSVATMTFTVVQDDSRVTGLTLNKVTNESAIYAITSVCILILGLLIAIIVVYARYNNKRTLLNDIELRFI